MSNDYDKIKDEINYQFRSISFYITFYMLGLAFTYLIIVIIFLSEYIGLILVSLIVNIILFIMVKEENDKLKKMRDRIKNKS